ncbi:YiiX/YebB-like N1pC/P60 family cysteine hydrolase [Paenibacillus taiwanensis]|uniref:YiiX/YebB-like N1pC/P60 family cysteine hydrolase n=1 Tax=Paenibacillus taiwanensis TaxID=401638 RepID=UPI00041EE42F|nr:YiiX/YebB-like N1pC/P60 family cysteine hydrolase [Paenibacillus taiwanensis]
MKMKKFWFLALCTLLLMALPMQAGASSNDKLLDQIISLHGNGLTKQELKKSVVQMAKETRLSEQQVSERIYKELVSKQSGQVNTLSAGGGSGGNYPLDPSRKGTFFFQPASTLGIPHGHVGFYYSNSEIVESHIDGGVRKVSVSSRSVASGARIQAVNVTTKAQDELAADWANGKVGGSYNLNFFNNRSCTGKSFNCSQLVWCAFKEKANIDIDQDGGWGVYPVDIRDSNKVSTLKTY